jgi:hypothetical protein
MEIPSLGSTKARKLAVGNLFERKYKILEDTRVDLRSLHPRARSLNNGLLTSSVSENITNP